MGTDIPFGPAYKLPNLLLKCVAVRPELTPDQRERIVESLHVPLDSYTIQALRGWINLPAGGRIPSTATMNFVRDIGMYEEFQAEIRWIADLAGVPPIAFDDLAWDAGHQKTAEIRKVAAGVRSRGGARTAQTSHAVGRTNIRFSLRDPMARPSAWKEKGGPCPICGANTVSRRSRQTGELYFGCSAPKRGPKGGCPFKGCRSH